MDKDTSSRCNPIDFIRGLSLISMMIYHTMYDLVFIFGIRGLYSENFYYWQQSICWSFILISGISFQFIRKKKKNILVLALTAILISLVTWLFIPEQRILFGIIHFMALALLVLTLLEKPLSKVDKWLGLLISLVMFYFSFNINDGYLSTLGGQIKIPNSFYKTWTFILGLADDNFYSADYFSLIPWFFLYLTGFYLGLILDKKGLLKREERKSSIIHIMGRNSLLVYLIHQPLIYGILYLLLRSV